MRSSADPFLRWVGGKRWLASSLAESLRNYEFERYFEPFLGAGSVFFALRPTAPFLSDVNEDLIQAYSTIATSWRDVEGALQSMPNTKAAYYDIRASDPLSPVDRCARFIYLNRTCFGGIYRTNKKGRFNVPYGGGRTTAVVLRDGFLQSVSESINSADISVCDFEQAISRSKEGDLIYCDPVYVGKSPNEVFSRYGASEFSWSDQQRLASVVREAVSRGASVILSNWETLEIRRLYHPFRPIVLSRRSHLSKFRDPVREGLYILSNRPQLRMLLKSRIPAQILE